MSEAYSVWPTASFERDLIRLEDHIVERELASETPDASCLERFRAALVRSLAILEFAPHTCRRSDGRPYRRELVVPFGRSGCVVLFEIRDANVFLLAARHQNERDFR